MRRINLSHVLFLIALVFTLPGTGASAEPAPPPPAAARPLILVHYMPWYEAKPVSGAWGWHWTMNHFDPERSDATGRREIASHYYPLIGPYDSADPHRSGWAWGQEKLEGGASMLEADLGDGKLFLFGPEITFRGQSHGTFPLLFNAIYYGTATGR